MDNGNIRNIADGNPGESVLRATLTTPDENADNRADNDANDNAGNDANGDAP